MAGHNFHASTDYLAPWECEPKQSMSDYLRGLKFGICVGEDEVSWPWTVRDNIMCRPDFEESRSHFDSELQRLRQKMWESDLDSERYDIDLRCWRKAAIVMIANISNDRITSKIAGEVISGYRENLGCRDLSRWRTCPDAPLEAYIRHVCNGMPRPEVAVEFIRSSEMGVSGELQCDRTRVTREVKDSSLVSKWQGTGPRRTVVVSGAAMDDGVRVVGCL